MKHNDNLLMYIEWLCNGYGVYIGLVIGMVTLWLLFDYLLITLYLISGNSLSTLYLSVDYPLTTLCLLFDCRRSEQLITLYLSIVVAEVNSR